MKRYAALSSIALILILLFAGSFTVLHAQQSDTGQTASDLFLDLKLAQDNPSPDQKAIATSTEGLVREVATTGQETVVTPQDKVDPAAKTESTKIAVHSEETSSEQVVEKPVTVEVNENGTPVPTSGNQPTEMQQPQNGVTGEPSPTQNLVPGTNVSQPDDNAAPMDNSTDPNLPAPTSADTGISPTPSGDQAQPSVQVPSGTTSPQPTVNQTQPAAQPVNDQTQPSAQPTVDQSQPTAQPTAQPATDTSTPAPTDSSTQPATDQSTPTPDTTSNANGDGSVQGAATMATPSLLQNILQPIKNFLHSLSNFFGGR